MVCFFINANRKKNSRPVKPKDLVKPPSELKKGHPSQRQLNAKLVSAFAVLGADIKK